MRLLVVSSVAAFAVFLLLPSVSSFQPGGGLPRPVPVQRASTTKSSLLSSSSSAAAASSTSEEATNNNSASNDEKATTAAQVPQQVPNRNKNTAGGKPQKVAVIVCPAQFCVPDDYQVLFDNLRKQVPELNKNNNNNNSTVLALGTCMVAPLPRTEWIKVAKKLPTQDFLQANLPVHDTLNWYFDALETAIADVLTKEGPDVNLCIIGHSIGGWVARAYLGGLSR
jgi:hypothetical protein